MSVQSPAEKPTLAVIGGRGMLGADLVELLGQDFVTTAVDLDNYEALRGQRFDVVVNANGNARRYWANAHPLEDFEASCASVYRSLADFPCGRYVYLSSSDVYKYRDRELEDWRETTVLDPARLFPYGLHKLLSEQIVRQASPRHLILRPSMILGRVLRKGPVYDLRHGIPLFITRDSRIQMITARVIAEIILRLLRDGRLGEVFNVGGRGTCGVREMEVCVGRAATISEEAALQLYQMNVEKLAAVYPLATSREYLAESLRE